MTTTSKPFMRLSALAIFLVAVILAKAEAYTFFWMTRTTVLVRNVVAGNINRDTQAYNAFKASVASFAGATFAAMAISQSVRQRAKLRVALGL